MTPSADRLRQLEALYSSRFPSFVRVARAILGDRERAVEAVQDGFADAIRNLRACRGEGDFEAWVWRVVVNAARKAARRPLVEVREVPTDRVELPPALPEVAPHIAQLPERQRIALFLRHYADLDYASIAAVLGVEVGTVSATLSAAHGAVRRALEAERMESRV